MKLTGTEKEFKIKIGNIILSIASEEKIEEILDNMDKDTKSSLFKILEKIKK